MANYGIKIKKYRVEKGFTQNELAEMLHVTPQAVSKWENGQSEPDLTTLKKLAKLFEVSVDDLLGDGELDNEQVDLTTSNNVDIKICSRCHKPYGIEGLKEVDGKLVCHECLNKEELLLRRQQAEKLAKEKEIALEKKARKKLLTRFIIGSIVGLAVMIFFIVTGITETPVDDGLTKSEFVTTSIVMGIMSLTFITQMFYDSWLREMFTNYVGRGVRMPGVIFSFSLDGIIFLIVVKLIFKIIGFLISAAILLFGLAITFVISPVTYIVDIIRLIKKKDLN